MEDVKIIALMEGYGAGTLSDEEALEFFQWYSEAGMEEFHRIYSQCNLQPGQWPVNPAIPNDFQIQLEQAIRDHEAEQQQQARTVPIFRRYRLAWAAAVLLLIGAGGYFYLNNRQPAATAGVNNEQPVNDKAPGTTKAVLTLADGRKVIIDSSQTGQLAVQGRTSVLQEKGSINYNGDGSTDTQNNVQSVLYNTLTTNRGEQSPPLVLADGTKVWLNALSSIRFPVSFTGDTRDVIITGEAYFEVATLRLRSGQKMPFRVIIPPQPGGTGGAMVEVLGTHFNINAYSDEDAVKTTLLEGSVKVVNSRQVGTGGQSAIDNEKPVILKPGQQAIASAHSPLTIDHSPDVDQVMAWKRGLFDFNHASLQTVLRQLARWYNIDVKFEGSVPNRTFRGKITRDLNLSQVINILQDLDIKFRLEGNTLLVSP